MTDLRVLAGGRQAAEIVVVEDDPARLCIMHELLTDEGCRDSSAAALAERGYRCGTGETSARADRPLARCLS